MPKTIRFSYEIFEQTEDGTKSIRLRETKHVRFDSSAAILGILPAAMEGIRADLTEYIEKK